MKKRLDLLLVELGLSKSRSAALDLIKRGEVLVDSHQITKASAQVSPTAHITVTNPLKYVGRGGLKLEHALTHWGINVKNKTAIDIGSSTGGFTDCLLQHGAKKVYAVDVGTHQLDASLKNRPEIILHEQTDIRNFSTKELVDIVVIDVSFISLTKLFPKIKEFLTPEGILIALLKPQFEVGKEFINRQGLVKSLEAKNAAVARIEKCAHETGFIVHEVIESPIAGGSGNTEYLLYLTSLNTR